MIKNLIIILLCISCIAPTPNESAIDPNDQETRIKSISLSSYNSTSRKFIPSRERTFTYSNDYKQLEYIVSSTTQKMFEKYTATYENNVLMSHVRDFVNKISTTYYQYDKSGKLINYVDQNNNNHYQDSFIYNHHLLLNHKQYFYSKDGNKELSFEENCIYDSLNLTMKKTITSQGDTKLINYTFNSKQQITSKSEEYAKYKISYEGDTLINIEAKRGTEADYEIINTTINYTNTGLIKSVISNQPFVKYITNYTYDLDNNLSILTYSEISKNGNESYTKYEFGPYNNESTFIFPPWFSDCGILNNSIVNDLKDHINDNTLNNSIQNNLDKIIKSFPDYYIEYHSKDSIDWTPFTRMDFEFETS